MSSAFTEIAEGMNDAIAHAKGEPNKIIEHKPETVNVKAIRQKTGMTQQHFCAAFGISIGTLRHWEQGQRTPRGPARLLLKMLDRNPQAVIDVVNS